MNELQTFVSHVADTGIIKTNELCLLFPDKRHSDIMTAAEQLLTKLGEGTSEKTGLYLSSQGKELSCYDLPYDIGLTLIGFFDPVIQYQINQEWLKLTGGREIIKTDIGIELGDAQGGQMQELRDMVRFVLENQKRVNLLVDRVLGLEERKQDLEFKRTVTYKTIHQWLIEHTNEHFGRKAIEKIHKAFYETFPNHLEHANPVKQNRMDVYDTDWLDSVQNDIFNIILYLFPSKED